MKLSELENAVLGVVLRKGPCSAYTIQQNFSLVSASWSASPGSVYPLVHKLHRLGLLASVDATQGKRPVREYTLTRAGRRQLRNWVAELPDWIGRPPADAVRTRSFFLDILPTDEERLAFIDTAKQATRRALDRLRQGVASVPQPQFEMERLGQLGGIYQLEARLAWLEELRNGLQLQE